MSANVLRINEKQKFNTKYEEKRLYEFISGLIERLLAFIFLMLVFPALILLMVLIKLEDGGPVVYSQNRVGKDGRLFVIYKMRTMYVNENSDNFIETRQNDNRITKVGKFIRSTRIDELPQLFNILIGNMKLIGPRPLVEKQIIEYTNELPEFVDRLVVKPGLTGWAQVNGGNEITPKEKLFFDVEYIKNRGFRIYMKVIFKTVWVVLSGAGAR